jgi:hypothetical protein
MPATPNPNAPFDRLNQQEIFNRVLDVDVGALKVVPPTDPTFAGQDSNAVLVNLLQAILFELTTLRETVQLAVG